MAKKSVRSEITEAVRQFSAASGTGTVTKKQVRESLGYSVDQVAGAVGNLVKEGWLRRLRHGVYEFIPRPEKGRPGEVNDRIWRAMMIQPPWSAADISRLSGTTSNYVYKRIRMYWADGFIERCGQRSLPAGGAEKLWRVTAKGRQARDGPMRLAFKPDPLILDVVELNRLVCSGMTKAMEKGRVEALGLCRKVEAGLKKLQVT